MGYLVVFFIFFFILLLVLGLIVSYFLFFENKLLIMRSNIFQRKCKFLFFLLDDKIKKYINHLEYISKKNLFYVDKYNYFFGFFNSLLNESKEIQAILSDIKIDIHQKNFIEVRKKIFNNKRKIFNFEKKVIRVSNDLEKFFYSEEKQKQIFFILNKKIRDIELFSNSESKKIEIFQNRYKFLFVIFERMSEKFEKFLDIGEFNKSKIVLKKIEVFVENFERFNNFVNDICDVLKKITSKIFDFNKKFDFLENSGHDLYELIFERVLFIKNSLIDIFKKIKQLKFEKVKENLINVSNKMNELYDVLLNEEKACKRFILEVEAVNKQFYFLERFFDNFCNLFNQVSKIYILDENTIANFNNLKKKINIIKSSKQVIILDNNKNKKKCYFFVLNEIDKIKNDICFLNEEIFNFEKNILSIKNDIEKFFILIYDFFFRLKKIEKMILDSKIKSIYEKYEQKINNIYDMLNETMDFLTTIPIDIEKIRSNFNFFNLDVDSFMNRISSRISNLNAEEKTILYLNGISYDNALFIEENIRNDFFNGECEKVLNSIKKIL